MTKLTVAQAETVLSDKQKAFAEAYLASNWDVLKAAEKVGYTRQMGANLLRKRSVMTFIEDQLALVGLTRHKALARLSEVATANIGDFLDGNGEVRLDVVKERGYLVKKYRRFQVTQRDGPPLTQVEIELHDALSALTTVAKAIGLLRDVTVNVDNRETTNNVTFDFSKVPEDELLRMRQTFEKAMVGNG